MYKKICLFLSCYFLLFSSLAQTNEGLSLDAYLSDTNTSDNTIIVIQSSSEIPFTWSNLVSGRQKVVVIVTGDKEKEFFRAYNYRSNVLYFGWTYTETNNIDGYYLYYGPQTKTYINKIQCNNPAVLYSSITNLPEGTNYVSLTAFNSVSESDFSNELKVIIKYSFSPTVLKYARVQIP